MMVEESGAFQSPESWGWDPHEWDWCLMKETPESSFAPSPTWHRRSLWTRKHPSPDIKFASTMILHFPASKMFVVQTPRLWYFCYGYSSRLRASQSFGWHCCTMRPNARPWAPRIRTHKRALRMTMSRFGMCGKGTFDKSLFPFSALQPPSRSRGSGWVSSLPVLHPQLSAHWPHSLPYGAITKPPFTLETSWSWPSWQKSAT